MIEIRPTTIVRGLAGTTVSFCLLGLGAELLMKKYPGGQDLAVLRLLSLSYEGNLPSWYASALPLLCAGLLAVIAAGADTDRGHWRMLALGFVYISIDEAVGLHEMLGELFDTSGLLHFGWVMPATAIVLTVGLVCLGFLRRLDRPTARRFVLAGALYVTGAVLFELPLGWWTEQHGADNLGYALIDWVEETLEFVGLTLFAASLLRRLQGGTLRVTGDAASR